MSRWLKKVMASTVLALTLIAGLSFAAFAATISGTITYTGSQTGNVAVVAFSDASMTTGIGSTIATGTGPFTYSITIGTTGDAYVMAYMDVNSSTDYTSGVDPVGQFGSPTAINIATVGDTITGKDFSMTDPGSGSPTTGKPFTIKLAVGTSTTPISGATVEIWDTKGDWMPENDVKLGETTTSGSTYSSESGYDNQGQATTMYFNATIDSTVASVLADPIFDAYGQARFRISVKKNGYQKVDNEITLNANSFQTMYTANFWGGWDPNTQMWAQLEYVSLPLAPTVAITERQIYVGTTAFTAAQIAAGTVPSILPGSNDQNENGAEIAFKYAISGTTNEWEMGGTAKICIDTNGSGTYDPFDYSAFFWDSNGGPYYSTDAGWNWTFFNNLTTAQRLAYKLTQQQYDVLRGSKDWSMDQWISGYDVKTFGFVNVKARWDGRDNSWNIVPAATYTVQLKVYNPNYDSNDETANLAYGPDTDLKIKVAGSSIAGTIRDDVGNAVPNIRVNAGSMSSWGSAYTNAAGAYVISGLVAGSYHLNTESGTSGFPNQDRQENVIVTADQQVTGIDFTLERGGSITGTITIPAPGFVKYKNPWSWTNDPNDPGYYITSGNLNINAWSPGSPQHGWTNVFVEDDNDAAAVQTVSYTLNLPPGTYNLNAQLEGYASNAETAIEVVKGAATAKNITMVKAGTISGTVTLPAARADQVMIDVSAESSDGKSFGWGGTMIPAGSTSVPYTIRSLAAGTYTIRFNCWGKYKPGKIEGVVVTAATDVPNKDYTFDAGQSLKGKIKINASTLDVMTSMDGGGTVPMMVSGTGTGTSVTKKKVTYDPLTQFTLWINAWSPSTGYGTGAEVVITKSATAQEVDYEITGLEDGVSYQLDTWLFGFELKDRPVVYTTPNTTADISLEAFAGSISGKVTGTGVDMAKVRIIAREPWWDVWRTPKVAAPAADGTYTIEGIGTGEYIVTCNEYSVAPSTTNPMGQPSGNFGMVTEREPVANGEAKTGVDFALATGATIQGVVTISATNPPLKSDGTAYTLADLAGKTVEAYPVKMMWMGWTTAYKAMITINAAGQAVYSLSGLGDDIYSVVPQKYNWATTQTAFSFGQPQPDVAVQSVIVAVKSGDTSERNFEISNGYNITGTIQRPSTTGVAGDGEDHFFVSLNSAAGNKTELGGTSVDFMDQSNWEWLPASERVNNTTKRSLSFTLKHVPNGNYVLRIFPWKNAYKETSKEALVASADLSLGTFNMAQGASIKAKLVDAETGMAVTDDNGVSVHCEARPWIEGSWRDSSQMFEEDMSGTSVSVSTATDTTKFWEKQAGQKTGVFRMKNLPAGTYMLEIVSGGKTQGSGYSASTSNKVYINQTIAGIVVPDSTDEVDLGTIKLKGGVTISGNVTDTVGNKVANVLIAAIPSGGRKEVTPTTTKTDKDGKFILEGINPLIGFWDITAAYRPRDNWRGGVKTKYGEQTKIAIAPLASNVNFVIEDANANVSGRVLAIAGRELAMPFPGDEMPVADILLQNQSQTYSDPFGGVEEPSTPDGRFTIYGVVPTGLNPNGTKKNLYTLKVFSKGAATYIRNNIELSANATTSVGDLQLISGASVGGTIKDTTGKNVASSLFELPLVSTPDFSTMTFGTFTTNSATNEIERYDIEGLTPGTNYYVVLAASEGADLYVDNTVVTAAAATDVLTKNITWINKAPAFMAAAVKNETGNFLIGLWATESVTEAAASDVVTLVANPANKAQPGVTAQGSLAQLEMALDKQEITGVFTPHADDEVFTLKAEGHDVTGLAGSGTYTFDTAVEAYNVQIINPLMGGSVSASNSDPTKLTIPPGAVTDPDDPTGNIDAEVSKAIETGAAMITSAQGVLVRSKGKNLELSRYPKNFQKAVKTTNVVDALGKVVGRVSSSDKVSSYYDFKIGSAQVQSGKTVKVTIAYDSTLVTDTNLIDVYYLGDNGWVLENTGRTVDTTNRTISAEVNHASLFAAFKSLSGANAPSGIPDSYTVYPYPNPFKKKTAASELTIKVGIPAGSTRDVKIKIFNIVGELVREINESGKVPGWHDIIWNCKNDGGSEIASGVYIAQVEAGGDEKIVKIAVLK